MEFFQSEENRRKLYVVMLAFGFCLLVFVGYRILYVANISEYSKEFVSGCLGAVITIIATAALLKSQTDSEVTRDQLSGMFREKLDLYRAFIEFLNNINSDGEITPSELKKVIEWAAKLSLVCRPGVVRNIYEYVFQLVAFGTDSYEELSSKQRKQWKAWMLVFYDNMSDDFEDEIICSDLYSNPAKIISALRDDLTHKKMSNFEENLDMQTVLSELFSLRSVDDIKFKANGDYVMLSEA